jgi:D-alanyl-D-alanine carboxypeptidase
VRELENRPDLTQVVEQELRKRDIPGGTVALFVDGRPILVEGVGYADLNLSQGLTGDAQFYLYSITKTILATAVLRLAEQGQLSLGDHVQRYLPDIPLPSQLTVRQILQHSGGLPDYGGLKAYSADLKSDPRRPWTDEAFLSRALSQGFVFQPGKGWAYSNIGYLLVRLLLERVSQRTLPVVLDNLVFRPIGLRQTFVAKSLADAAKLTPGYSSELETDNELHDVTQRYDPRWVSHGVVISTASDLALTFEALFTGALLAPESLDSMMDAVVVPGKHPPFVQPAYGLGLMIDCRSPFGMVVGHGGGGPGYSTAAFHYSDVGGHPVTAVALVNRDQPGAGTDIVFALVQAHASGLD